jgi:hypothetical protein
MRYLNVVLFVFLGMASFCSNAAPQKFKYFKMDIPYGWEAKEAADGYSITVEPEDAYIDHKGRERIGNVFLVGVYFPDAGESAEQSAKRYTTMQSKDKNFDIKNSSVIADNKNNLVIFSYFAKSDADVLAMTRSVTLHTIPMRPPVQAESTVTLRRAERSDQPGGYDRDALYGYTCNGNLFFVSYNFRTRAMNFIGENASGHSFRGEPRFDVDKDTLAYEACKKYVFH